MCTACGSYTEQRVENLCLPCPGRARASKGGLYRVGRFLKGRHPESNGASLGDAWLPPDAVVEALVSHTHRETPGDCFKAQGSTVGGQLVSVRPGSAEYRIAFLTAMGLEEDDLARLVADRARPAAGSS